MDVVSRTDAKAQGLKRYFTGKPCKHGHVSERYIGGDCVTCKAVYREANQGAIARYKREYLENNRDAVLEYHRQYRANNREARIAASRRYREENRQAIANAKREYREANREAIAAYNQKWRDENPHRVNAQIAKRRAAKLQATPPWLTKEHHDEIGVHYAVSAYLGNHHVDHIVPLNHPEVCGLHVPWNLQVITVEANLAKSNTLPPQSECIAPQT